MDPLEIFENFKLDTLDEKWSDEVWEREFLSFPEPPVEYSILLGSEDMELFLKETRNVVKKWIEQNMNKDQVSSEERPEVSWQTLTALNINIRGLLAVLGYLIKIGQAAGADEDARQPCLASASLYFTLLSIPGSSSFHVFHPNLYQRAIETLKLSELLQNKKTQKVGDFEKLYSEDKDEELRKSEKITLIKGLNSILFDLITMLNTFYMKYQARSLEITVMSLVDVTKLETEINHFEAHSNHKVAASKTSLSYNAYVALQDLCDPRHGPIKDTIRVIMKYLMPHLFPNYLDLPSRACNTVWDTTIHFIRNLLDSNGSNAELGIETLVQHLLLKCPDRSEPRQKQAGVIAKIINICHGQIFCKLIENLIKFAFHNKIPYRIFAQEVIGKLLSENVHNILDSETDYRAKTKIVLTATALSRCVDCSSMVRGKAMSIIESILHNEKVTLRDFLNISEEDSPFPTQEVISEAFTTDINPLPGLNTFNTMLLSRIKDERALVRRSAMHALQDLTRFKISDFPPLLDKIAPVIGLHCRDPALSVRKDAVHVLASLLEKYPHDDKLMSEFIKSVLPRIYDVETKVQEKVLESLQNLILDKISSFNADSNAQQQYLPWKIINQLTEHKMRKNLSKICDSWVKTEVINNSLINKIQTHIDTEHDAEAWILMSALAENFKITNMEKHFEDYKKIIQGNDFVTTLKLEVLRYIWQSMGKEYLENLHAYIFDSLCKFHASIESIGICIDILGGITKRLRGSEAEESMHSQVVELMKLSEVQIEKLADEDTQVDDDTIDVYLKAMNILGHASFLCSENVSEITLNIIQGLLLDCDSSVHMSDHCLEKFKAAGVVVLGQQAMRDREVAEQVMPILGRLMVRSSSSESLTQAAIRINAVKALADLCIRFTALVEPYLPDMCISMKDPNVQVRETIVVIFVQLLLEDYIKVKGAFFYHILTMLSDNDETIKELTIFLIKERLLTKNKLLISQSFVRSIFHYNNCETRHKFNDRKIRKKEKDALTLPENKNETKRRVIYDFMLEHLDPPSKLKILTKLNSEVFEGVSEKFINIAQSEGACVLKDTIYIIANDRMQATFGHKIHQDEDCQDEGTAIEISTSNALNVIAEGMKKFKLSVMVPTLIRLREFLSAYKSPLLIDVSKFFSKLISEFNKDQVAEIYDEHPQLKKDIDRDISMCGKNPEADDSDFEEELESVNNSMSEENENCALKKRDFNSNIAKTNKSNNQNSCNRTVTTPRASTSFSASTPRKIQDIQFHGVPRIVLRRLSTLTYPGIQQWMSPPRESNKSQCSDPGPSSSGISSNSPSEDMNPSSSDFSEPEISSTPKPRKKARLSRRTDNVQKS